MEDDASNLMKRLQPMQIGILLSMLTLLYGFGLGIAFGKYEDQLKGFIKESAEMVYKPVYRSNMKKMKKIIDKSWKYFKRSHFHAGGMGTSALALILLLSFYNIHPLYKTITSVMLGAGSLGYPVFWLFAGIKAPGLGNTHIAKESLAWLAIPSSGLFVAGVLSVFAGFIYLSFIKKQ